MKNLGLFVTYYMNFHEFTYLEPEPALKLRLGLQQKVAVSPCSGSETPDSTVLFKKLFLMTISARCNFPNGQNLSKIAIFNRFVPVYRYLNFFHFLVFYNLQVNECLPVKS
jgi:hypothetical protein